MIFCTKPRETKNNAASYLILSTEKPLAILKNVHIDDPYLRVGNLKIRDEGDVVVRVGVRLMVAAAVPPKTQLVYLRAAAELEKIVVNT